MKYNNPESVPTDNCSWCARIANENANDPAGKLRVSRRRGQWGLRCFVVEPQLNVALKVVKQIN